MIHFIFLEYYVENNNLNSVIQKEQGSWQTYIENTDLNNK